MGNPKPRVQTGGAHTLMSTTICTAGCSHCPFSNPSMEKLSLPVSTIEKILAKQKAALVVLSGGEPFEHPEITEVLELFAKHEGPFRIATGAHLSLTQWLEPLRKIGANPYFEGISLGSDVLSDRCSDTSLRLAWTENLQRLGETSIPYSLTFTIGHDLPLSLVETLAASGAKPQFFYLRYRCTDRERKQAWETALEKWFPGTSILTDELGAISG